MSLLTVVRFNVPASQSNSEPLARVLDTFMVCDTLHILWHNQLAPTNNILPIAERLATTAGGVRKDVMDS